MTTLRFSHVADDSTIGHVTMTGAGLEYDNDDVKRIMSGRVAQLGEKRAFALASGYSNGYVASEEVDDADGPDAESPAEDDAEVKAARSRQLALLETRALGHDTTPGHDELHHYWTVGEGRHQWVDSPKPWTTLVALLTKHVGPEKAKVYASRWFIEVKGYAAGSDLNRVAHGHPPRGSRVGPG